MTPEIQKEIEEYKKFALNKNLLEIAVGLILATSFQKMVVGINEYLIMPFINYFVSNADGNWKNIKIKIDNNLFLEIGKILGVTIEFFITTFVLYVFYKKILSNFIKLEDPKINNIKTSL